MSKRSESKAAVARWESAIDKLDAYGRSSRRDDAEYRRLNDAVLREEQNVGWFRRTFR